MSVHLTGLQRRLTSGIFYSGISCQFPLKPSHCSDGIYNWSADMAGTFFLKEAARHGVPIITLFVNSAVGTYCGDVTKLAAQYPCTAHDNDQQ